MQHNTTISTQHNANEHNSARPTQLYATQHNTTISPQHNHNNHNTRNTTQHFLLRNTCRKRTQHNTTQHDTTQHNPTQHNTITTIQHKCSFSFSLFLYTPFVLYLLTFNLLCTTLNFNFNLCFSFFVQSTLNASPFDETSLKHGAIQNNEAELFSLPIPANRKFQ